MGWNSLLFKGWKIITTLGVGFVDDVTLGVTVDNPKDQIEDAKNAVSAMGQYWERELFTTGGKLELPNY